MVITTCCTLLLTPSNLVKWTGSRACFVCLDIIIFIIMINDNDHQQWKAAGLLLASANVFKLGFCLKTNEYWLILMIFQEFWPILNECNLLCGLCCLKSFSLFNQSAFSLQTSYSRRTQPRLIHDLKMRIPQF